MLPAVENSHESADTATPCQRMTGRGLVRLAGIRPAGRKRFIILNTDNTNPSVVVILWVSTSKPRDRINCGCSKRVQNEGIRKMVGPQGKKEINNESNALVNTIDDVYRVSKNIWI